jgi:hypothetical protein
MPLRGSVASVSCSQTQMFFTGYPIFLSSFGTRNTGSPREEKEEKEEEERRRRRRRRWRRRRRRRRSPPPLHPGTNQQIHSITQTRISKKKQRTTRLNIILQRSPSQTFQREDPAGSLSAPPAMILHSTGRTSTQFRSHRLFLYSSSFLRRSIPPPSSGRLEQHFGSRR